MAVVSIVKVEEERVEDAVRRAIELADGFASLIPPGATVLIKPNDAPLTESRSLIGHVRH